MIDRLKVVFSIMFVHDCWAIPLQTVVTVVMVYFQLGLSALVILGVLVLVLPLVRCITKRLFKAQKDDADRTDARVTETENLLNSMEVVKCYAWEKSFATQIDDCRTEELSAQFTKALWQVRV